MPWRQWRELHADTTVMVPTGRLAEKAPRQPLLPSWPMPKSIGADDLARAVVVVGTTSPAAVASTDLRAAPINLTADGRPVVAFRDPRNECVRAFARKVDDLSPKFKLNRDAARAARGAFVIDLDTDTGWSPDGVAVDAKKEFRNKRLAPVVVEDGLYWGVMKFWYPNLELGKAEPAPAKVANASGAGSATAPSAKAKPRPERGGKVMRPPAATKHAPKIQQSRAD
jgi:hypothetical protein